MREETNEKTGEERERQRGQREKATANNRENQEVERGKWGIRLKFSNSSGNNERLQRECYNTTQSKPHSLYRD